MSKCPLISRTPSKSCQSMTSSSCPSVPSFSPKMNLTNKTNNRWRRPASPFRIVVLESALIERSPNPVSPTDQMAPSFSPRSLEEPMSLSNQMTTIWVALITKCQNPWCLETLPTQVACEYSLLACMCTRFELLNQLLTILMVCFDYY